MSQVRHHASRIRGVAAAVVTMLALVLAGCSGPAALHSTATTTSTTTPPAVAPPRGLVLAPGDVASIVASDTAINNQANAALSMPLQDSHEACLQQVLDDATYRGDQAAGSNSLGAPFDQVPSRAFVPREGGYPAFFSVLVENRSSANATTPNLLTYVKSAASARWKLTSSSEILGPTNAGVTVPAAMTDAGGFVTSLDPTAPDGLVAAPDKVAARVAAAFTSEAASGSLPAGISAQFGPNAEVDPHVIANSYAGVGSATAQFTSAPPAAVTAGAPSRDCPYPAIRLADGGALVTFAIFLRVVVHVRSGSVINQPPDRSALGGLLPPGTYSSVSMVYGDVGVAIVPPSGSASPIDVIGQTSEGLTETGVAGSGSSNFSASGGPTDASSIANEVDSGLVDVDTTLSYEREEAAGTGMVLTPNGEVLTNNHVIEGATSVAVTDVGNGKTYPARVVGYDRTGDVAVLRLDHASGLQTVRLGNSSNVHPGQAVVGIGNAGGRGGTPSYAGGSVAALHRSITASDDADGTSENLTDLIATNAEIEPGDSGGPLVTGNGSVIGMDTAASGGFEFQSSGLVTNESFSIPIDDAVSIAKQIESGTSTSAVHIGATAFLGVTVEPAPAVHRGGSGSARRGLGSAEPSSPSMGIEITEVVPGSPAAQARLLDGDTITSFDGKRVTSPDSFTSSIEAVKPGIFTPLIYVDSNGRQHSITVRLASGPPL